VTQQESWPKIAVVGAGAVGRILRGLLARAGAPVVMIGRAAFVEAVSKSGLFLDTLQFQESVRVEASTELSAVRGAQIVLFCVKTTDNATTARALAPLLAPGAIILIMQMAWTTWNRFALRRRSKRFRPSLRRGFCPRTGARETCRAR